MKRTPVAAAIAAVFLIAASSVFAQTGGSGTSGSSGSGTGAGSGQPGSTSPSTPRSTTGTTMPTPPGATGTGKSMDKSTTSNSPTVTGAPATTAPGVPETTAKTAASGNTPDRSARSTRSDKMGGDKNAAGDKLAHRDRKFMEKVAADGMAEVELGKLAAQKATDPAVKQFAEQMVKDHTDANQKLTSLAQAKGLTLPAEMKHGHERHLHKLEKLSGDKFDRQYIKEMLDDHKKDAKAFDKEAKSAKDPDVRKFAADNAPVIHQHLAKLEDMRKNVRKGSAPVGSTSPASRTTTSSASPATTPSGMAPGSTSPAPRTTTGSASPSTSGGSGTMAGGATPSGSMSSPSTKSDKSDKSSTGK